MRSRAVLLVVAVLAVGVPARADPGTPVAVVTTPAAGYLPGGNPYGIEAPLEVMEGGTLIHVNLDNAALIASSWGTHGLESDAVDANDVPLFASDEIGFGSSDVVEGVESLPPGTYPFHCVVGLHASYMRGVLVVTPSPV
jgi:hypothetical protein